MINNDRIVPVQKIDLLSLYATIGGLVGATVKAVKSADVEGNFAITEAQGGEGVLAICDQPVKTFDFGADVSADVIYFIPAYDYEGFSIAGTKVETEGDEVKADGVSLYKAVLGSGDVDITALTPLG